MDTIRKGKIESSILQIFYGCNVEETLKKKYNDIRSIQVGIVCRRLTGKIVCFDIKNELCRWLIPIQFGFGIKGDSEAIVHGIRSYIR